MSSVALRTRVNQITILVGASFLFYQITGWEQGIWVLISTLMVAGPISTFLSYEKAKDRFLGTLVGVWVAFLLEKFLHIFPAFLPLAAFLIALLIGFMVTRPYKYFIIVITICTCMTYTYMNMPFTPFEPASFVVDRSLGVFFGVLIFLVLQQFVFGTSNAKLEMLEASQTALVKLQTTLRLYQENPTLMGAYQCATDIFANTKDINGYVKTAHYVFGQEDNDALRYARQVMRLNNRALKLLVDEPTVSPEKMARLLHIVDIKLERA